MAKFDFRRWDNDVLIASEEAETVKEALENLVRRDVNLYRARLDGASLVRASLDGASLDGASLVRARLDGASLVRASLDGASLDGASLDGASLDGASLDGASLDGASLVRASLDGIKHDLWAILFRTPNEVEGLALALKEGRVDGSAYQGECACLVGTLANIRHCNFNEIPGVKPDSNRPAETWFLGIKRGDTPENNSISKLTLGWIEEFQTILSIARAK